MSVGLVCAIAGYAAGRGGTTNPAIPGQALAGPTWDSATSSYVSGVGDNLTYWRVEGGKVVEATAYYLAVMPAVYQTKTTGEGAEKKEEQVKLIDGGPYIFNKTYKPAPPGMPPPLPPGFVRTVQATGGPSAAPSGAAACGGGKCG